MCDYRGSPKNLLPAIFNNQNTCFSYTTAVILFVRMPAMVYVIMQSSVKKIKYLCPHATCLVTKMANKVLPSSLHTVQLIVYQPSFCSSANGSRKMETRAASST